MRVYHLGLLSLWRDEGFTYYYSTSSLSYLWTTGFRQETNPPLYYTVMHFWIPLFGRSEFALRSFSALASFATIPVVYALGRELGGRSIGLLGALLVALLPSEIWYAQEARTYALLQLAISVALLGAARYLLRGSMGNLALYGVGTVIAVYSHDSALIFVAALNLAVIGSILWDSTNDARSRLIRWVGGNVVIVLAISPVLATAFYLSKSDNIQWIPSATSFGFLRMIAETIGGPAANREFLEGRTLSYLLLLCTALSLLYFQKLDRRSIAILVLPPVIFIGMAILIDFYKPLLIPRILLWTLIPLSLLIAHLLIHAGKMRPVIVALVAAVLVIGLDAQWFPSFATKENWGEFLAKNQDVISGADVVVLGTSTPVACFYYYAPGHLPPVLYWHSSEEPMSFARQFTYEKSRISPLETDELTSGIKSGKRVCLVLGRAEQIKLALSGVLPKPDYQFADELYTEFDFSILAWNYTDKQP
jgi:4-amino-4-deoxy-L-arabinose transferase-like glycosyltransferase